MTEEKLFEQLGKWGEKLLAWILCTVLMSATIYVYLESTVNLYSVIASMLAAGFILLFDFIRSKKFGGLIYTAILICVGFVPAAAVGSSMDSALALAKWFFSGAQAEETTFGYIVTLTVVMCFFLTSAIYYFTHIVYRSVMMTLVTLIPFAIAIKAAMNLPYAYAAAAAALNLLFFLTDARKNLSKTSKPSGNKALMVYTDFAAAAIFLALIIPKPSVTPYYDKFKEISNRFQFGGSGEISYLGSYKKLSGNADNYLKGESRLLYMITTNNPVYMKYQVFDLYDEKKCGWVPLEKDISGSKNWQETAPLMNFETLAASVGKAAENEPSLYEIYPQAEKLSEITEKECYSIVYARDYPSVYVLAPLRATSASLVTTGASYSARSYAGEIFTNLYVLPDDGNYTIRYYSENTLSKLMENGLCDISCEDYGKFLETAYSASGESDDVLNVFYNEYIKAEEYRKETQTEVSEEIQALADEITADLKYDYQKAQAIENYFTTGEYIYSLSYEAPKNLDTPEYFIFQSKTGTCSDFATAYTLIARAAGLNVRYAEGFVPCFSGTTVGLYYIYTENAHAYPEVYIPGAGWVQFEPTPADFNFSVRSDNTKEEKKEPDYLAVFLTAVVVLCGSATFILLVIFTPKIIESIFRLRIRLCDGNKAIILLYKRHAKNIESRFGESCKAFTPEQLAEYTEQRTEISLIPLTKPFIEACYGGAEISSDEKLAALECYKVQKKEMYRKKKKRRK